MKALLFIAILAIITAGVTMPFEGISPLHLAVMVAGGIVVTVIYHIKTEGK